MSNSDPTQILTSDQSALLANWLKNIDDITRKLLENKATIGDLRDLLVAGKEIDRAAPQPLQTMAEIAATYDSEITQWSQAAHTGHSQFDDLLGGGFLPGRLYALLGAPGSGKTSIACQWAANIADCGIPVVYLSSEDSPFQLYCRTLARLESLEYGSLLRGMIKSDVLLRAMGRYSQRKSAQSLAIIDHRGAFSIDSLESTVAAHVSRFPNAGVPLIVIDYLQRLARSSESMASMDLRFAVTRITEQLREFAKQNNIAVLVLASQNRESYKSGGNGNALASAKESGDIEYTADVLAALVEDKDKDKATSSPIATSMLLKVEKNRQGLTKAIKLDYVKKYQRFDEVTI